jgi:hypothetical protein
VETVGPAAAVPIRLGPDAGLSPSVIDAARITIRTIGGSRKASNATATPAPPQGWPTKRGIDDIHAGHDLAEVSPLKKSSSHSQYRGGPPR